MTLIELLAALSISGLAILGGVVLLNQLDDANERIAAERSETARAGNGDRLLARLLADAQSTPDTTRRFVGDARVAQFFTYCDVPGGWSEPCRTSLMIDSLEDTSVVIVAMNDGGHFETKRIRGSATFRYLDLGSRDSGWVHRWAASGALPDAIALVSGVDTLILPLGSTRD